MAGDEPEPLSGRGFDQTNVVAAEMGMPIPELMTPAGRKLQVVNSTNSVGSAMAPQPRPKHIGYFYPPGIERSGPDSPNGVATSSEYAN